MGLTKFVLKRPVTTVMALLCLLVFGISSVFSATLEQMPDMETPMMIVSASCNISYSSYFLRYQASQKRSGCTSA